MAVDEVLSEAVLLGDPVIRFYCFSPPTLSVGRFQKTQDSVDKYLVAQEHWGFVRRPTGGQGVFHANELTYSLALSKHHVDDMRKRTVYRYVSELLIAGLKNLGIAADFSRIRTGQATNPHCFGTTGEYEIVGPTGKKIIGSAQVRGRNSCLQQGSIPLDDSFQEITRIVKDTATENQGCTSLSQELKRQVTREEAEEAFRSAFAEQLPLSRDELTEEEVGMAEEILHRKYAREEWNHRF